MPVRPAHGSIIPEETRIICMTNQVVNEQKWRDIWDKRELIDRAEGRLKEPSRWVIGKYGRPEMLPLGWVQTKYGPQPSPSRTGSSRSSSSSGASHHSVVESRLSPNSSVQTMKTSHSMTEMKRSFALERSVLGEKFSTPHQINRRMY
mmetsp:Transcript_96823/g.172278  ORF Transcript_96823/g.172278 Transcript_96823/m.172278 type:complete len:148 (+) Transcript_96823:62-505(+)